MGAERREGIVWKESAHRATVGCTRGGEANRSCCGGCGEWKSWEDVGMQLLIWEYLGIWEWRISIYRNPVKREAFWVVGVAGDIWTRREWESGLQGAPRLYSVLGLWKNSLPVEKFWREWPSLQGVYCDYFFLIKSLISIYLTIFTTTFTVIFKCLILGGKKLSLFKCLSKNRMFPSWCKLWRWGRDDDVYRAQSWRYCVLYTKHGEPIFLAMRMFSPSQKQTLNEQYAVYDMHIHSLVQGGKNVLPRKIYW